MKSLLFLTFTTLKNRVKQILHKPSMLILCLLFIGALVFSIISTLRNPGSVNIPGGNDTQIDMGWLKLIFLFYLLIAAFSSIYTGLSTGSGMFSMPDVNFLFVSPVKPKSILFYSLVRQSAQTILSCIFILFMGSTLNTLWGLGFQSVMFLFFGCALTFVFFQLIAMVIFIYTKNHPHLKKIVIAVCALLLIPTLAAVAVTFFDGATLSEAVLEVMNNNLLLMMPIAGWSTIGVFALIEGNLALAVLALALNLSLVGAALILLSAARANYYEDVLVSTETAFQRLRAAQEGNLAGVEAAQNSKRKINLKTLHHGVWGNGASSFLGRHLLEISRRGGLKILNASSFSVILTIVFFSFFMRDNDSATSLLGVLPIALFMQTFLVGTGLGLKEVFTHYIFMVPASSFSKIIYSNLELIIKSLLESIIAYTAAGIITKSNPLVVILLILISVAFTYLLVSINLLSMRIFANVISQGILLAFYFLFVMLAMAPGVFLLAIIGFGGGTMLLGLLALLLWELAIGSLFFYLSRGVLDNCDIETMQRPTK